MAVMLLVTRVFGNHLEDESLLNFQAICIEAAACTHSPGDSRVGLPYGGNVTSAPSVGSSEASSSASPVDQAALRNRVAAPHPAQGTGLKGIDSSTGADSMGSPVTTPVNSVARSVPSMHTPAQDSSPASWSDPSAELQKLATVIAPAQGAPPLHTNLVSAAQRVARCCWVNDDCAPVWMPLSAMQ